MDSSDIAKIAKLAKLDLSSDDVLTFSSQLSNIISYIDKLGEIETEKIEPMSQVTGLSQILREDTSIPENTLSSSDALSGTEKTHNGYFVVDALIDKGEDLKND